MLDRRHSRVWKWAGDMAHLRMSGQDDKFITLEITSSVGCRDDGGNGSEYFTMVMMLNLQLLELFCSRQISVSSRVGCVDFDSGVVRLCG